MSVEIQQIVQVANMILSVIVAFGGIVPVVGWLKKLLNPSPRYSQLLTVSVCVVYTVLSMIVQGTLAPETVTLANAGIVFTALLTGSQAEYQRILRREDQQGAA